MYDGETVRIAAAAIVAIVVAAAVVAVHDKAQSMQGRATAILDRWGGIAARLDDRPEPLTRLDYA